MIRRLIILLLIVGCEETTMTVDDFVADRIDPQDCAGVAGGSAVEDNCGVCDAIDGYVSGSCYDCAGVANGTAIEDCLGVCGGLSYLDECGGCVAADDNTCEYELYADEHWDFGRWIHDYYKWYEYIEGNDDWNAIREVFINKNYSDSTTGCAQYPTQGHCYIDFWDHSRGVEFTYDGSIMSSNSEEFKEVFRDLCGNINIWDTDCSNEIVSLYDNNNDSIFVIKDDHFYEGIHKYNRFTAGWDDNDCIYVITNDANMKIAMTPHKLHYHGLYSNP